MPTECTYPIVNSYFCILPGDFVKSPQECWVGINPDNVAVSLARLVDVRGCANTADIYYFLLIALAVAVLSYCQSITNTIPGTQEGIEERASVTVQLAGISFLAGGPFFVAGIAGIVLIIPWWWPVFWGIGLMSLPVVLLRLQVLVKRSLNSVVALQRHRRGVEQREAKCKCRRDVNASPSGEGGAAPSGTDSSPALSTA